MDHVLTPGKGLEGQNCNVTACQKPDSAHHYNKVMHKWYCLECAEKIQYWALIDPPYNPIFDNVRGVR
jgi:hypothetical protein